MPPPLLVCDHDRLELNPFNYWQPVKFLQYRGDVIILPTHSDYPNFDVLNPLQPLYQFIRQGEKKGITVI